MATIPKVEKLGCHASRWRNLSTIDLNSLVIEHGADGRAKDDKRFYAGPCLRALGARSDVEKACNQKRPPQGRKVLLVRGASVDICFEHGRYSRSRYCQSAEKKARLVAGDLRVQKASGTASCTGCFGRETKTNRGEKP